MIRFGRQVFGIAALSLAILPLTSANNLCDDDDYRIDDPINRLASGMLQSAMDLEKAENTPEMLKAQALCNDFKQSLTELAMGKKGPELMEAAQIPLDYYKINGKISLHQVIKIPWYGYLVRVLA